LHELQSEKVGGVGDASPLSKKVGERRSPPPRPRPTTPLVLINGTQSVSDCLLTRSSAGVVSRRGAGHPLTVDGRPCPGRSLGPAQLPGHRPTQAADQLVQRQ